MQVELVPGGRGWLVFVLCDPCEDFGMLITCCEFLLPLCLRMTGAVDVTCQRDGGRVSVTTEKRVVTSKSSSVIILRLLLVRLFDINLDCEC